MKTSIFILLCWGSILAQTDTNRYDPYNDKVLLQLIRKDSLSADEKKIYADLMDKCLQTNKNQNSNNSDSSRGQVSVISRDKEVFVGFGMEITFGLYRITLPLLYTMLVYSDPNYEKKVNASSSCAIIIVSFMAAYMMQSNNTGAGNIIGTILLVPGFITNSEHHLMLISSSNNNPFETSLYVTSRVDVFNNWWRYTVGGGLQIGLNLNKGDNPYDGSGFGLHFGYEKALLGHGIYDKSLRWFGGLSYAFNIR